MLPFTRVLAAKTLFLQIQRLLLFSIWRGLPLCGKMLTDYAF